MKRNSFFLIIIIILAFLVVSWNLRNTFFSVSKKAISIEKEESRETADLRAVSFITPHHLLARDLVEKIFQEFSRINKNKSIERIILISPNHFNLAHAPVVIPPIKEKNINIDETGITKLLAENSLFERENTVQEKDHGIDNILPYIAKYFSGVEVVPLLIRDDISPEKTNKISAIITESFGEKTIIILSADFSHYIGTAASKMHDQRSIEAISNLDKEKIDNLDIDCRGGLEILANYSQSRGYSQFNLVGNSSSSEIIGRDMADENTSYIAGYFSWGDKSVEKHSADILFLGDLMLDRYNRVILEKKGITWPTEKIKRIFWSPDINVANLEGPATSNPSISLDSTIGEKRHLVFTFDPQKTKDFLALNRINIVNIGNNHILNFGSAGLEETKKNLREASVEYFGDPRSDNDYLVKNINGYKVNFINHNQFSGINWKETIESIKTARKNSDRVIVYCHWGREYELGYTKDQEAKAHAFIDAGADLIIGSHPHVVEPMEIYKNKAIFYSLGDFFFDQYFSEEVKNMLAVGVSFTNDSVDFYLTPLYMGQNGQIELSEGGRRDNLIKRVIEPLNVDEKAKDDIIKNGIITIRTTD